MEKLKLGIYGLNYDTEAGRGWPGARYAPDSIRKALAGIMNRMEDNKLFDVCENKIVDYDKIELTVIYFHSEGQQRIVFLILIVN